MTSRSNPTFEHRHFKALAAWLASLDEDRQFTVRDLAVDLAGELGAHNPRFDRERFLAAARGEPSNGRDRV